MLKCLIKYPKSRCQYRYGKVVMLNLFTKCGELRFPYFTYSLEVFTGNSFFINWTTVGVFVLTKIFVNFSLVYMFYFEVINFSGSIRSYNFTFFNSHYCAFVLTEFHSNVSAECFNKI